MKFIRWRTAASLGIITAAAATPVQAQTKTFTANADFESGTLSNTADNNPADAVVLGRTPVSKTRNVWVSNTEPGGGMPGWIVRIDTTTGYQTARFDSVLQSINGQPTGGMATNNYPGRVAVDTNGDVWIVNRALGGGQQGSLSKFSGNIGHCIDRNNNGTIETSRDVSGDHIIDPARRPGLVADSQVEYYGQADECILATIKIGAVADHPRSVAVDKKGKVWVGTHGGNTAYRFNPNEPVTLEASRVFRTSAGFAFNAWFYSAATADDYVYFTSNPSWAATGPDGPGRILQIDINDMSKTRYVTCSGGNGGGVYGIVAVPGTQKAWAGAYNGSGYWKADFDANPATCSWINVPGQTTAVTLDNNGNVWVSGYGSNNVYKMDPNGNLLATCPTGGAQPHGLAVDFDGYIWSVQDGPSHLVRFSPTQTTGNCGRTGPYPIDTGPIAAAYNYSPYLYSDFTGVQIDRQAPYTRVGAWDAEYDSGALNMPWKGLSWNTEPGASIPPETSLKVSVRAANTKTELGQAAYTQVTNPASLVGTVGRYIQVKADFAGPGYQTPVLSDLNITGPCDTVNADCCITDNDCSDGDLCTSDVCPAPGGKCVSALILGCCAINADCNDKNQCTSDTCPVAGGQCAHAPLQNCCMSYADCADGDTCTADVCPSAGGSCSNPVIPGCCHSVADCNDGNGCTTDVCPADGELCENTPIANCCEKNSDCADSNLCTTDVCDPNTKSCKNTPIAECCNQDSECTSGDTCKKAHCSGFGGVCVGEAIPNCCTDQSPEVGKDCDEPAPANNHLPCKAGQWACENNALVCKGAVKPSAESCDWIDNDCEGNIDAPKACPIAGEACVDGRCVPPCATGEFPCKAAQQCVNGSCLPTNCVGAICEPGTDQVCVAGLCVSGDGGVAGTGGTGNTGGTGGSPGAGGSAGTGHYGGSGGGGSGGMGGGPLLDASTGDTGTSGAAGSGGKAPVAMPENYGLATGGGGCSCGVAGRGATSSLPWFGLALVTLAAARRRRVRGGM